MLERAAAFFRQHSVAPEDVVRVDVPGRGGSEGSIEGTSLRHELEPLIPALQSTSLFGNASGAEVVDAQNLLAGEAATIADLLATLDPDGTGRRGGGVGRGRCRRHWPRRCARGSRSRSRRCVNGTPPAGWGEPPPSGGSRSRRRRRLHWSSGSAPMWPRSGKRSTNSSPRGPGSPARRCSTVSATGRTNRCGTTRML